MAARVPTGPSREPRRRAVADDAARFEPEDEEDIDEDESESEEEEAYGEEGDEEADEEERNAGEPRALPHPLPSPPLKRRLTAPRGYRPTPRKEAKDGPRS